MQILALPESKADMRHIQSFLISDEGDNISVFNLCLLPAHLILADDMKNFAGKSFLNQQHFLKFIFIAQRSIGFSMGSNIIYFFSLRLLVKAPRDILQYFLLFVIAQPVGKVMQTGGITGNSSLAVTDEF